MDTLAHWVQGQAWSGHGQRRGDVHDPATGEVGKQVHFADAATVDHVVGIARDAGREWGERSLGRRTKVLFAFRELVDRYRRDLAELVTREHGKVVEDALGEVQRGLEVAEFACGIPHLLKGGFSDNVSTAVDSYSLHQPVGVCAGITPFNFPVMVPLWMHPVAIACGNSFLLKPSEKDPSASMLVAELWQRAGLPDGVFNVVHGDAEAVNSLLTHPGIAAISFVGSTPVARHVYEVAAAQGKRVQALGGAKNHMIVLPDADLEMAADAAVGAGYGSAGERCMAISVVVAVGSAGDPLVEAIAKRARGLSVGPGLDEGSEMGPLITGAHRDRVAGYVGSAADEGAEIVVDGRSQTVAGHEGGFWLGPCLLDRVTPQMTAYRDEIFGPVLSVVRAETYAEALDLVNASPYGNGTAVFTRDGGAARRFQHDVEAGMVGINVPIPVPMAYYSFGGWKDSLFGDAPVHGVAGVSFYTRMKTVTSRWPESQPSDPDFVFPGST